MNRLVWKFWLAIWLAVLAMLGAAVAIITQWQAFESYSAAQAHPTRMLQRLAYEIEVVLRAQGDVRALLSENEMSPFGTVYLIDPNGRDVLGRAIPAEIARGEPTLPTGSRASAEAEPLAPVFARAVYGQADAPYFMVFVFDAGRNPMWLLFRQLGFPSILAASLLISGLVSAWLALMVTRPVNRLVRLSVRHSQGDFDASIGEKLLLRRDELGRLARQLTASAQQIKSLLQRQKDFVRDVSHEVRSPLARLQVASECLEVDPSDARALARISREIVVIDQLVQGLLQLSRTERAMQGREPLRVDDILASCVDDAALDAKRRNVALCVTRSVGSPIVRGDPMMLQRVFDNLLCNALRYTAEGSKVDVSAASTATHWHLSVSDEGPGVPEHRLGDIFEPFVRLDEARARDTGGFGVGLALVKRITDLHGGSVQAKNRSPRGLSVTVALPLERAA